MPVDHRLGLAFVFLMLSFLVLIGLAAAALVVAGQTTLAAGVAGIGLAGLVGGALTYFAAVREDAGPEEAGPEEPAREREPQLPRRAASQAPLRVQSLPVAELPPAYLAAVMKGAQAHLAALKAQSRHH